MRGLGVLSFIYLMGSVSHAYASEPISFRVAASEDNGFCVRPSNEAFLSSSRVIATGADLASASLRFIRRDMTEVMLQEYGYDKSRGRYEISAKSTAGEYATDSFALTSYVIGVEFKPGRGKKFGNVLNTQVGNYVGLVAGNEVLWTGCIESRWKKPDYVSSARVLTRFELRLSSQDARGDADAILSRIKESLGP